MLPLPAQDLRRNVATWAVPAARVAAVAAAMLEALPREVFDPTFQGQRLETTYFDTCHFRLRKARRRGDRYLTLRLRRYPNGSAALSAKTEGVKFRQDVDPATARALLQGDVGLADLAALPADLAARLFELVQDDPLFPVVTVCATRYAVEDDVHRLTLDAHVYTDTGKTLPAAVLEQKSAGSDASPLEGIVALGLRPIKLSKFLWATAWTS
jgi:hypothetical protein